MPPLGVIVGVATVGVELIVKLAEAMALSMDPLLSALALTAPELVSVNGLLYRIELLVGSLPSIVYRIVAPDVEQAKVTCTEPLKVPPT